MAGFDNDILYANGERISPSSAQDITLMQQGTNVISKINRIGNPETVVSANPGSTCHDPSSGLVYRKSTGTGTTGWLAILNSVINDVGTATFSNSGTLTLTAQNGLDAGGSVRFRANISAAQINLQISNTQDSIYLGRASGNGTSTGLNNCGLGVGSMTANTTGTECVGVGYLSLLGNTSGAQNTGIGSRTFTLASTTSGNTGVGFSAGSLTLGGLNTIMGNGAMRFAAGAASYNTVYGNEAAANYATTESSNVVIAHAGVVGDNNIIRIGTQGTGSQQQNQCFIAGITGATVTGAQVLCDASGQLGTIVSSERFKEKIEDAETSILDLRPVTFEYKSNPGTKVYGLVAEEVEKTHPDLCLYDEEGVIQSVKYHELPAILLLEIQRLSKRVSELEAR